MPSFKKLHQLLQTARRLRAKTSREAYGRCLCSTLELCSAAQKLGIDANVIVWKVINDKDFHDHWAVAIDEARIIDITRAQIDNRQELVFQLSDYPDNFVSYRIYPSQQLVAKYLRHKEAGDKLTSRQMWSLYGQLLRHDIRHGLLHRNVKTLVKGALLFGRFGVSYSINQGIARLSARQAKLVQRLQQGNILK